MTDFVVVIPARWASVRLPGKPLREIAGRPMIEHVYRRGTESGAEEVIVATDDARIADAVEGFGGEVCMTGSAHRSGSERIAEVCDLMHWDDTQIVVNLQGDEPTMPPELIDQCADLLADSRADIATLASPLAAVADFENPNVVKVLVDGGGFALYFSRAPIPYARDPALRERAAAAARHHHGLYAYRAGVLRRMVSTEPAELEVCEQLEQLRALAMGLRIRVGEPARRPGAGVDTEADLAAAAQALSH
ncbi:MAG: 3-deoxy-manno-octulosonate cytidylyltransferase [Woeseiaceae bacterium]|nr:3-deoxy-manno-octulosonate cytidylyltransferase [Woeseiaceae bacterium]